MSFYFNYTGDTPSHSWSGFVQRLQTFACLFCCSGEEVVEDWHYQPIKFRFLGLNYYYIENQFNNNQESLLHCLFPWLSSTKWRQWMLWGSGWAGAGQSGAQKTHTQRAAVPCTNLVQAGGAEREGDCLRRLCQNIPVWTLASDPYSWDWAPGLEGKTSMSLAYLWR